jgi:TorA maturation chaperone TorD
MVLEEDNSQRSEAYRVLASIFFEPPQNEILKTMKEDFGLESRENEYDILHDFDHLFVLPGGKLPPLESLHVSDERTIPADAGLTIDPEFQPVPDHISLEFLFMSYLIDINRTDLQERFLEEHIMNWVPDYCELIKKEAKTVFYREIAEIAVDFLESEYAGLE